MDVAKTSNKNERLERLNALIDGGIKIDRDQIVKNMCMQFKDENRWIVEYAVNSYDANATQCYIWGNKTDNGIEIFLEDNGHGMDKKGVCDFATLFRSVKQKENGKSIGQFGIGKISPAAVPGQHRFVMETSTGKEAWRMTTSNLLSDNPVWIEKINEVSEPGTRFEITFKDKQNVKEELIKLSDILKIYLRYLPMRIVVFDLDYHDDAPTEAKLILSMAGSWHSQDGRFQDFFELSESGHKFDIGISLENGVHEIYKNRVFISDQYNLIFYDLPQRVSVPYLSVRVDSADFEMPFGRHKLSNEEILKSFSLHFRERILPVYLKKLFETYENGYLGEYDITPMEIQDMVCALLAHDSSPATIWSKVSVFTVYVSDQFQLLSLNELRQAVKTSRVLYLESDSAGIDYSVFDGPVLALKQPEGALNLLKKLFSKELKNLAEKDIILEAKKENAPPISELEKQFSDNLGFHPSVFKANFLKTEKKKQSLTMFLERKNPQNPYFKENLRETEDAYFQLSGLRWTVNYLVAADGKKPVMTHRFLVKKDKVVLNLYHPEIRRLIQVAEKNVSLAGHLALSMCLTGEKRVLPHLTSQMCEQILTMDAIAKCGGTMTGDPYMETNPIRGASGNRLRKLLRDAADTRRWLR